MKKSNIDISNSDFFPEIISDYLKGAEKLRPYYNYSADISSFKNIIADFQKTKFNRSLLAEVLTEQYSHLAELNIPEESIRLLKNENTFTVCTGHQLCLFTGPIYFVYKIISTINLSEELKKNFPEYNFVPVFWMAAEDHDFEEISHIQLFGKKLEWKNKQGGAAGNYSTEGIDVLLSEIKNLIGNGENVNSLLDLFSNAYLRNKNLAQATRYLINELFGKYGLLVFDGNDSRLKKEFKEIISDDLFYNSNFKLVNETITEFETLGYKHQVNPRQVNLFLLRENERKRIEKMDVDEDPSSWKDQLETRIEQFSPNVVLRPLYQQKILPNIAYIGGPNELAYWFEYKRMFDYHKVNFPILMLRNSVLFIDGASGRQIEKSGMSEKDIFKDTDSLIKLFITKNSGNEINFNSEKEDLKNLFREISRKAEISDASLKTAVEIELNRIIKSLTQLEKKMLSGEKKKNEIDVNRIRKMKEKLFPSGNMQERFENFIPAYLTYGVNFFRSLKESLNPFDNRQIIFRED